MHTDAKRYYALLGVEPDCAEETIRAAFRRRAKELHPDTETGNAGAFIRLKRAYDVLNDTAKRARYDRACRPRPVRVEEPHPFAPPRPSRGGGRRVLRYAAAFVFVAGISLAAVEWMISAGAEAPPAHVARPVDTLLSPSRPTAEPVRKQYDGFWDPTASDQRHVSHPAYPGRATGE